MVMASTCGVAFNLLQPKPLWAPAGWAVFFIGTISPILTLTLPSLILIPTVGHAVQISILLNEKKQN